MSEKMDISKKKCLTPEFRVSFPNVFKPKAYEQQEPKFSITMLFSKKTDLKEVKRAALNAATEKWGTKAESMIKAKQLRWPFRDGDVEKADQAGYENTIFMTASSKADNPPGVVDNQNNDIINAADFYAGCYARAELIAFAYDRMGNKGISFSLQNLQKLRDGEKFSGRKPASEVFGVVSDDADNAENYGEESSASMGF